MTQRGFTLLEVLVAIAIFSLLGLATWQLLDRVLHSDRRIASHEQRLRHLQRAMGLLERDLQLASRRALSDDASASQAMIGQPGELRLVRGGWRNPLDQPRSELLQVRHLWRDQQWLRETLPLPGGEPGGAQPQLQVLLKGVRLKRLRYVDGHGQAHTGWPADGQTLGLPGALEIVIDAPGFPDIRRVILMPGGVPAGDSHAAPPHA
ncbi:type II secretion system minor pseudopilin GspJ [Pseudomonas gregormendelii]|uniref:Type II secretion system protein J n=1 Tax=Pseudomonas gregormendelii TaxID=1628277 RepID=A0ABS3AG71_9PSED|nr:type II secretion system minor pseudopilin GspJ [Pseudomonas gregormendelii]MBN3966162.1 type II secretion system minor pseudopilin GspJ [Pseudomonas gregormendelii]